MKKTDNLFLDSIRFGVENMSEGISYNELKDHLKNMGQPIKENFEDYFKYWFFTHFYYNNENTYFNLKVGGNSSSFNIYLRNVNDWLNEKCLITSEAYKIYLDSETLEQSRSNTKKALKYSKIAIWISAGLVFIQIILQLISFRICC